MKNLMKINAYKILSTCVLVAILSIGMGNEAYAQKTADADGSLNDEKSSSESLFLVIVYDGSNDKQTEKAVQTLISCGCEPVSEISVNQYFCTESELKCAIGNGKKSPYDYTRID
ncbi:MAG: hypothetical protein IIA45_05405 [Bacteroidetes bacterium]|nr:hypothetical protein [Bacteroidota bacterium]